MKYVFILLSLFQCLNLGPSTAAVDQAGFGGVQPLSRIAIHKAVYAFHQNASVKAHPLVLGTKVKYML